MVFLRDLAAIQVLACVFFASLFTGVRADEKVNFKILESELNSTDEEVRANVFRLLLRSNTVPPIFLVKKGLKDPYDLVRTMALQSIGRRVDKEFIDLMSDLLDGDSAVAVAVVVLLLANRSDAEILPLIEKALASANFDVKTSAIMVLSSFFMTKEAKNPHEISKAYCDLLVKAIDHEEPFIAKEAKRIFEERLGRLDPLITHNLASLLQKRIMNDVLASSPELKLECQNLLNPKKKSTEN